MSAQDKLGLGMLMFLVFFVIAFLLVPRQVYQEYLSSLRTRGRGQIVTALGVAVFALSLQRGAILPSTPVSNADHTLRQLLRPNEWRLAHAAVLRCPRPASLAAGPRRYDIQGPRHQDAWAWRGRQDAAGRLRTGSSYNPK